MTDEHTAMSVAPVNKWYASRTNIKFTYHTVCSILHLETELQILYLEYWAADTALGMLYSRYCTWNIVLQIHCLEYWAADTVLGTLICRYCTWNALPQILYLEYCATDSVLGLLCCWPVLGILCCRYCTWNSVHCTWNTVLQIIVHVVYLLCCVCTYVLGRLCLLLLLLLLKEVGNARLGESD